MGLFILLKSTTVMRSYGICTICSPCWRPQGRRKIVSMVHLVVNIIKSSNKTLHTTVNDHGGDRMMLYRSRIDDDLVKISHTCHLGLGNATVPTAMNLVIWVLWVEIKVDFNDLKHIVHPTRRFYELPNTIMTCYDD